MLQCTRSLSLIYPHDDDHTVVAPEITCCSSHTIPHATSALPWRWAPRAGIAGVQDPGNVVNAFSLLMQREQVHNRTRYTQSSLLSAPNVLAMLAFGLWGHETNAYSTLSSRTASTFPVMAASPSQSAATLLTTTWYVAYVVRTISYRYPRTHPDHTNRNQAAAYAYTCKLDSPLILAYRALHANAYGPSTQREHT
eukprot:493329-Pyramimonas_sp.AAC.1